MDTIKMIMNQVIKPFNIDDYGELKEDEYIKDGKIYCKKCNGARIHINGSFRVRCLCKCQAEERDRKYQQEADEKRQRAVDVLKRASMIGERYINVTFANTETGHNPTFDIAFARCKRYCEVTKQVLDGGLGIYIYGDKGTGKTHLTACMANELITQRKQVLFTNFFEISRLIRSTFGKSTECEENYVNRLATIDYLFIDDIGTERVQNRDGDLWLQEKIFDVLNKRYNKCKPTVFSSNYSMPELIRERGFMDKTVDRIAEMSNAVLKIQGDSYRIKARAKR